ncbi:hypothetical protein ACM39_10660 [Chryseobacterium sp. FH2]|uniref:hypothetical protein n=1 Tax=Chryseobacterium sp. FH2 TaxID=1674291 RepID=UPI00065D4FAD|nr:hypothetical protein [Chryseobacterium sp. FH2]KMQ67801.1 hypothetical protein ACM39_10660 [Chryseobacterium sp. FH2]
MFTFLATVWVVMLRYTMPCNILQLYIHDFGNKFDWTEEQALKETELLNPDIIAGKIPKYAELLEDQHGSK